MDLVISLKKPRDITSQQAVSAVKNRLKIKKAGHSGTLDPIATGLLIICTGKATRLSRYFMDLVKDYRVTMKLGETTDTQDAYGTVTNRVENVYVDEVALRDVITSFEGRIKQTPPMFSAIKHRGKPLYKYAREGIEITRKERDVYINTIELVDVRIPFATFRVSCSKGTYIRTLCDDIGKRLGVGAHLFELERTAIGTFSLSHSVRLEELRKGLSTDSGIPGIYSMDAALSWMPELRLPVKLVESVTHGNPIPLRTGVNVTPFMKTSPGIRIKSPEGELLAVGSYSAERFMIMMKIVFAH